MNVKMTSDQLQKMSAFLSSTQTKIVETERLTLEWKEECHLIVNKNRINDDKYEAELTSMKSELISMS